MKLAVLKERNELENRVAVIPETVEKIITLGFSVTIEAGAGEKSFFSDADYINKGAKIAKTAIAVLKDADVVLCVNAPTNNVNTKTKLHQLIPHGSIIIGMMNPFESQSVLQVFSEYKFSIFALEMIPRISRAQSMDVLSSQSNLAGYKATLDAMSMLGKAVPMMMTAAGTIKPAKVLILGAGVAGLQAIATAKRMGAIVSAFDVRSAAKEQVESLGATFIEVPADENVQSDGVYAQEMSKEYQNRQKELLAESIKDNDIVITTALIPGKKAPVLVTKNMVVAMKTGSVLVDLAAGSGGNIEGSKANQVVEINGVNIVGYTDYVSKIANDASQLYARNIYNFLEIIVDKENKKLSIDLKDEIVKQSLLTHKGSIVHKSFKPSTRKTTSTKKQTPLSANKPVPKKVLDRKPYLKKVNTNKPKITDSKK